MFSNSPVIQLFMIVVSVGIVILFIMPTIDEFRATQDQIAQYEAETIKVVQVTELLEQQINTIENLPIDGRQALDRFVPNTIDEIAVMRDIESIVERVGLSVARLEYSPAGEEGGAPVVDTGEEISVDPNLAGLTTSTFSLGVITDYATLKQLLAALESNNYQFLVREAAIAPAAENGSLDVTLRLEVYTMKAGTITAATVN